jgi:hypothetical protein
VGLRESISHRIRDLVTRETSRGGEKCGLEYGCSVWAYSAYLRIAARLILFREFNDTMPELY